MVLSSVFSLPSKKLRVYFSAGSEPERIRRGGRAPASLLMSTTLTTWYNTNAIVSECDWLPCSAGTMVLVLQRGCTPETVATEQSTAADSVGRVRPYSVSRKWTQPRVQRTTKWQTTTGCCRNPLPLATTTSVRWDRCARSTTSSTTTSRPPPLTPTSSRTTAADLFNEPGESSTNVVRAVDSYLRKVRH